jgi:FkbM family methyltransferase
MTRTTDTIILQMARFLWQILPDMRGKARLVGYLDRLLSQALPTQLIQIDGQQFALDLNNSTQRWIYYVGGMEPEVSALMKRLLRPGDVVADVGANFGYFTIQAAQLVTSQGRVYAFEPLPQAFQKFIHNLTLNQITNVVAENVGLGETETMTHIQTFTNEPDTHASLYAVSSSIEHSFECQIRTLDTYFESQHHTGGLRLIKMDVEGSEWNALRGAIHTLTAHQPHLIIEFNPRTAKAAGVQLADMGHWLEAQHYQLHRFNHSAWEPFLAASLSANQHASFNVWAKPTIAPGADIQ